jgi:hypothetical protein
MLQYVGTSILDAVDGPTGIDTSDRHSVKGYQYALWIPTTVCCTFGVVGMIFSRDTYPIPPEKVVVPIPD